MPKITDGLPGARTTEAARQIARETDRLEARYGRDNGFTQPNVNSTIATLIRGGQIEANELPAVARELLRRGTDWNPFNNFGLTVSDTDLKKAAVLVESYARRLGVSNGG